MTINKSTPPAVSVLEACERGMCASLAQANDCRRAKDTAGEARHLARLAWWVQQATERLESIA